MIDDLVSADLMPDVCPECSGWYYPYLWVKGIASYQCQHLDHADWQRIWFHAGSGNAMENKRRPQS